MQCAKGNSRDAPNPDPAMVKRVEGVTILVAGLLLGPPPRLSAQPHPGPTGGGHACRVECPKMRAEYSGRAGRVNLPFAAQTPQCDRSCLDSAGCAGYDASTAPENVATMDTTLKPSAMSAMPVSGAPALQAALAIAIVAAATLAGAWFFQLVLGIVPCPLCLEQRYAYYLAVPLACVVALAAQKDAPRGVLVGGLLLLALAALANAGLGAYHAGVEWRWWLGPTDCTGPVVNLGSAGSLLERLDTVKVIRCEEEEEANCYWKDDEDIQEADYFMDIATTDTVSFRILKHFEKDLPPREISDFNILSYQEALLRSIYSSRNHYDDNVSLHKNLSCTKGEFAR
eukprot:gene27786-36586_t